ncbi:MAG: thioesterase [Anaerolineales bacterium]|nr:thioesterase [Anaerolineales bacterium]
MTTRTSLEAWVAGRKPRPQARRRLLCLPFAGGAASLFRAWPDSLPPEVEVWPIQLPGRETRLREQPLGRMDALVTALAEALRPALDLPLAIFGHSMGALVGFELARALAAQGAAPTHLFISAMRAPQLPDRQVRIAALPDPEFIEALRRLKGTPEPVLQNAELMDLLLPALRADFALVESYAYAAGAPLACPIAAFGGQQDERARPEELQAWATQTTAGFQWQLVPGDHFFIRGAPQPVLAVVGRMLAEG